MEYNLQKAFIP